MIRCMYRKLASIAAAVALLSALGACGSDDSTKTPVADPGASTPVASATPTESAIPAGTPACDEVWQEGETLPKAYRDCVSAEETLVTPERIKCSSGQVILTHADMFWAVAKGEIHRADNLNSDKGFQKAMSTCRG